MRDKFSHKVESLLFDLGGVVIDIDFNLAFTRWAEYSNGDVDMIKSGFSMDIHYQCHERGEISAAEYFHSLRGSLGIELTDEQFEDGWNSIFLAEMPGMTDLLYQASQKMPIYAFTNTNATHQKAWSGRFAEILSHFDTVFVSSEMGLRKPDPESFHYIAHSTGMDLQKMLFFDDSMVNIEGAKRVGMKTFHVSSASAVQKNLQRILS